MAYSAALAARWAASSGNGRDRHVGLLEPEARRGGPRARSARQPRERLHHRGRGRRRPGRARPGSARARTSGGPPRRPAIHRRAERLLERLRRRAGSARAAPPAPRARARRPPARPCGRRRRLAPRWSRRGPSRRRGNPARSVSAGRRASPADDEGGVAEQLRAACPAATTTSRRCGTGAATRTCPPWFRVAGLGGGIAGDRVERRHGRAARCRRRTRRSGTHRSRRSRWRAIMSLPAAKRPALAIHPP